MNYKLAKQLKDAGFPQGVKGSDKGDASTGTWLWDDIDLRNKSSKTYVPTLSELIEACFKLKNPISIFRLDFDQGWWTAETNGWVVGRGKTPEEAVANLWLALNTDSKEKAVDESLGPSRLP